MARSLPRLSFSLRTLLVLMTLVGGAFGYGGVQWRVVQEREDVLRWLDLWTPHLKQTRPHGRSPSTWLRRMLGDRQLESVTLIPYCNHEGNLADDRRRIGQAFPEATIVEIQREGQ